uniref:Uncharacterized protein n=1 Tax=uncultured Candidatus Melainabacteria bacterium TaxID=2682970 RepID=A0A650EL55_9BACT|nr:hypothetical protein Melaina855_2350 [uncultured Candidatus Melainabacteria bacterium]
MDETVIDKKYTDFIENLIEQVTPLLPQDVNELQKSYLVTNIRKSANLMAESILENEEFSRLDFDSQCFYIQVIAEWSFHKEIDLFRSGIPPRYWKGVMQKIWYAMWEVMYACVKNDAPESVVLSLVERFVNRTYKDAVEELKESEVIDENVKEKAKEQSNIDKMAQEYRLEKQVNQRIKDIIKRFILALIIGVVVTFTIIKFKIIGLASILTLLLVYHFMPTKQE